MADCPPGWNVRKSYWSESYLGFHAEAFIAMPLQQIIAWIMQTLPFSQREGETAPFQHDARETGPCPAPSLDSAHSSTFPSDQDNAAIACIFC
jgi:hypothetical protein